MTVEERVNKKNQQQKSVSVSETVPSCVVSPFRSSTGQERERERERQKERQSLLLFMFGQANDGSDHRHHVISYVASEIFVESREENQKIEAKAAFR